MNTQCIGYLQKYCPDNYHNCDCNANPEMDLTQFAIIFSVSNNIEIADFLGCRINTSLSCKPTIEHTQKRYPDAKKKIHSCSHNWPK